MSVAIALTLLFAITIAYSSAYGRTRLSRAEDRYREGLKLAAAGRNADAAEDFRAALLYEHDDPRYRFALAEALVALKRFSEAENYLFDLRTADPTSGPVNLMLARIAAADHRDEEAIEDYHRAIFGFWPEDREQKRVDARFELVSILDRDNQSKQALAELLQLADEVPESDLALREKVAGMLLTHGSPQHAADIYRAIVTAHPHDVVARQGLGETEFEMGNFQASLAAFHAAVRYGAITPILAARIALLNSILDLDPTLIRLSAHQRFERARELLTRSLNSASRCQAVPPDLTTAAQAALAQSAKRQRDGQTAEMLTLSQDLWRSRLSACPRLPEPDQPLAVLMNRMPNQ